MDAWKNEWKNGWTKLRDIVYFIWGCMPEPVEASLSNQGVSTMNAGMQSGFFHHRVLSSLISSYIYTVLNKSLLNEWMTSKTELLKL